MNALRIELRDDKNAFLPGETVHGVLAWECDERPQGVELKAVWMTKGPASLQGTDWGVLRLAQYDRPDAVARQEFSVTLPRFPYSFEGRLTAVRWLLQLELQPGMESATREIIISPTRALFKISESGMPVVS